MIEITDDIWNYKNKGWIVIPTNGDVNRKGQAVMGRGIALQAKIKIPGFEYTFGYALKKFGNCLMHFSEPVPVITFPVKHHWMEKADLGLIKNSAGQLFKWHLQYNHGDKIYIPRVGCGNGSLDWKDVKPILEHYFHDRDEFIIVSTKWDIENGK